jgi:hypothetical protein
MIKNKHYLLLLALWGLSQCKPQQWKGQEVMEPVSTSTVPIATQDKGVTKLTNEVYLSNDFNGARMNKAALVNDTVVVTISPENTPINDSPWYSFWIWSREKKNVWIKIQYTDGFYHRYNPKLSSDGLKWERYELKYPNPELKKEVNSKDAKKLDSYVFQLAIDSDITWVSAQPLLTTDRMSRWTTELSKHPQVKKYTLGNTPGKRPFDVLQIGNPEAKKVLVLLGRQHPPEVTGSMALHFFAEELLEDNAISNAFRKEFTVFMFPLINPDGVDMGHWRHNANGVDLNRDWGAFNQPETQHIKRFFENLKNEKQSKIYAMVDFHSTWEDIFYLLPKKQKGNAPNLFQTVIEEMQTKIEDFNPNISYRPKDEPRINSMTYFYDTYNATSMVFEIGDQTTEYAIRAKAKTAARLTCKELLKD